MNTQPAQVRPFFHGDDFGSKGLVIEAPSVEGDFGPLQVWLPGSAGSEVEVSFPSDFWRGDREGLVWMRDALDLAIKTLDAEV